ncbi:MAG: glycosyltransferase family 1 protein [Imperialibacter sp.]|uniref:glycosyltransferase family 4 protein n=1 Tax=Imperialibacter sp. TaxID=2038411 RepID=UPI0032EC3570
MQFFWIKVPVWRSSVITTISQATKDELLKYVTCDPEKVKVVYVPVSPNFRRSDRPFNSAKPSILQIGTKPNKNVPRLIEALKDVPCTLDIVGELTEEMIRALESYKISYINSSRIPENELISKYENCDIVSFVSTYEGFGMPIVEANIVGKPVITSNILSMPEIAGNAAHLVDPLNIDEIREGFRKLIGDWAYRNELVMNGYENHQRFSAVRIAKQLEEIYTDLLN